MITLTLYKNCRLNDSYKNVLSQVVLPPNYQTSPFSAYLESLQKITITLDEVYQEDRTTFNFYLKDTDYTDIYLFNYMKIVSRAETNAPAITRYAFINSITIMNEIGVIDYKIDIWHTFSSNINGLNKSYLKGLRVINGTGGLVIPYYYKLPVEYAGNNELVKDTRTYSRYDNCNIIIELQMYTTETLGVQSYSKVKYVCLSNYYNISNFTSGLFCNISEGTHITFNDVESIINMLLNKKNGRNVIDNESTNIPSEYNATVNNFYYDIGNIYIIPCFSNSLENIIQSNALYGIVNRPVEGTVNNCIMGHIFSLQTLIELDSKTFTANFKRKSIGIISYQIPIINNGTSISCKIECSISPFGFRLFLNTQNKYIDITDSFKLEPLFTQANGDVLAQQRIQRAISNLNNFNSFLNTGIESGMGFANAGLKYYHGQNMTDYYSSIFAETGKGNMGLLSGMTGIQSANITGLGAGISLVLGGIKLMQNTILTNLPLYNSSSIVVANNIAILNCYYWLCSFSINSDNDYFVKESINNMGYNIYAYLDDITKTGIFTNGKSFTDSNINYNIIQFGTCDVYGNFPLDVKNSLDNILMNGIKIWYTNTFADDSYIVG